MAIRRWVVKTQVGCHLGSGPAVVIGLRDVGKLRCRVTVGNKNGIGHVATLVLESRRNASLHVGERQGEGVLKKQVRPRKYNCLVRTPSSGFVLFDVLDAELPVEPPVIVSPERAGCHCAGIGRRFRFLWRTRRDKAHNSGQIRIPKGLYALHILIVDARSGGRSRCRTRFITKHYLIENINRGENSQLPFL